MLNMHGDRITALELMGWLAQNVEPQDHLLIMVGEGEAALMVWSGDNPGPRALDIPVFTEPGDFFSWPTTPAVDYFGENITGAERVRPQLEETGAEQIPERAPTSGA
jgi:hypothetical protein